MFLITVSRLVDNQEQNMLDPLVVNTKFYNENINDVEMRYVISKAKTGKSVGPDLLPNEVLKSKSLYSLLLDFFQLCFDSSKIPNIWTRAIIVPIPKSTIQKVHTPLNYRGLSLLCTTAKLYTSFLNKRLLHTWKQTIFW